MGLHVDRADLFANRTIQPDQSLHPLPPLLTGAFYRLSINYYRFSLSIRRLSRQLFDVQYDYPQSNISIMRYYAGVTPTL